MPNRTEATARKRSQRATGRLQLLRLFSTLLPIATVGIEVSVAWRGFQGNVARRTPLIAAQTLPQP